MPSPLPTPISFHWNEPAAVGNFRTGVSLHSHTLHSKELLDFIPRIANGIPALRNEVARLSHRFESYHGRPIDFRKGWWTPPLCTPSAVRLESRQIASLGLQPLVSLTDHDTLQTHAEGGTICSVELTVQLGPSFVHMGIHNLPAESAKEVLALGKDPAGLMEWLRPFSNVLVVLNHPLWDEAGFGVGPHRAMIERFLARFEQGIHALELNGLRPWEENQKVIALAEAWGIPVISGGDRHGLEPNANINLTQAESFEEFVAEIRNGQSHVLFLPQYRRPFAMRIAANAAEILHTHPDHALGWTRWSDRVFYELEPGCVRSLSQHWSAGEPTLVRAFVALAGIAHSSGNLAPVRLASGLLDSMGLVQECRP